MVLPLDWKMGKNLEWCTQLPYEDRPETSPSFLFQNTECYFYFCNERNGYYYVYLKPKVDSGKLESFWLEIYIDYHKSGSFSKNRVEFCYPYNYILHFSESHFYDKKVDLRHGFRIRFLFVFEHSAGLLLSSESKVDEKSTQADLMLSLQTDVEYLSLDFGELLKTGSHSDVQLLCKGGNIPAHKAVLAARSKAFSDMFQDCTEENKSGLINLTTTDKSVMELCLEFIYKGKISNFPVDTASSLYVLGHVLKISSLTKMCADQMVSNLCEDNYISNLILADKYDDEYFKRGLIDYIYEHTELLKSESWVKFSDEHMKTAIDVYRKCMFK